MKTLYFEGAGCVPRGDVENCRIRTAFSLDNGKKVYLEITGSEVTKRMAPRFQKFKNAAFIDHCHYIYASYDDENDHKVYRGYGTAVERTGNEFEYTHENILKFVNSLGASFDEVVILPDLAGYRVHGKGRTYNLGDEFYYDVQRTEQAEKIKKYYYDKEKEKGVRFPCFSIWFEDGVLKVRFFDGRGTTEIPDIYAFEFK